MNCCGESALVGSFLQEQIMSKYKEGALSSVATAIAAFLLTIASAPPAQTQTVELKFGSPPSAQGWIYRSECAPAFPQGINLPEASAFSLNNGLLRLDTAGREIGRASCRERV